MGEEGGERMIRQVSGIAILCLAGLGTAGMAGGEGQAIDPSPVLHLQNGARIYHEGLTAQGRVIQNSHGMEGVGCAMCHGEDGRGGTMHGMFAPNITLSFLTDPKGYQDPRGRKRPPYNQETVKAAIVAGIDSAGHALDPEMPRWNGLTPKDLDDLIKYLEALGRPRDGGPGGSVTFSEEHRHGEFFLDRRAG